MALVVVEDEIEEEMEKYEITFPSDEELVCLDRLAADGGRSFYMYWAIFMELDIRLPFSSFQMGVLNFLQVAPSQVHPNAWGFIRVFELFCQARDLLCTVRIFPLSFFSQLVLPLIGLRGRLVVIGGRPYRPVMDLQCSPPLRILSKALI